MTNTKNKEAPLWPTKTGGFYMARVTLTPEMVQHYRNFFNSDEAVGGQLSVMAVKNRAKEFSPYAYIKVTPAVEVEQFIAAKQQRAYDAPPRSQVSASDDI